MDRHWNPILKTLRDLVDVLEEGAWDRSPASSQKVANHLAKTTGGSKPKKVGGSWTFTVDDAAEKLKAAKAEPQGDGRFSYLNATIYVKGSTVTVQ